MSNNQAFQIQEKLASLQEQLNESVPNISTLLRDIHSTLKKDPEIVSLLSEEECATLVKGLSKQTSTEIATSMSKKGTTKSLKSMTVSDL